MAIFGVPQFTPVVASPLDESDDEPWDRSARKKTRSHAQSNRDDRDIEFPAEDALSWDDDSAPPRWPVKKSRATTRTAPEKFADGDGKTTLGGRPADETTVAGTGKTRPALPPSDVESDDETTIRTVANEEFAEESAFVETAAASEELDEEPTHDTDPPAIPSYRRQRPLPGEEPDSSANRNARGKRNSSSPEPLTWRTAVQRLNDLGIRNFRLEPGVRAGEFAFTCSYTPSNSPHVTRPFEAEADDPLKAVAKVLTQVEEASQQRVLAAPAAIGRATRTPRNGVKSRRVSRRTPHRQECLCH